MHQAFVKIIVDRIKGQFITEQEFYQNQLGIETAVWNDWKMGVASLSSENSQKIKHLFSDYEWMLIQKLIRQASLFPEKRNYVVSEYKRLKSIIAQKWIQSGQANVELITQKSNYRKQDEMTVMNQMVHLRITMEYEMWGYDDILTFNLPAAIQQQIEKEPIDLLEWVNENLTESYLETNKED